MNTHRTTSDQAGMNARYNALAQIQKLYLVSTHTPPTYTLTNIHLHVGTYVHTAHAVTPNNSHTQNEPVQNRSTYQIIIIIICIHTAT